MFYGQPHIDTKISLFLEIIILLITAIVISILIITLAKKWKIISLSKVVKSNLSLYGTLICIYITSFILGIYINNFSKKNDLFEKIIYILFFLLIFLIQSFFILKYFYKNTNNSFLKGYKVLILLMYFISLIYILTNYFPDDAYDKYLTHSKTYTYTPTKNSKTLLDNSILKIDSATSTIEYFSNKESFEKDLPFIIYFNCSYKTDIPFSFKALDSTNEICGSSSQIKYKELYLKKLDDSIKILLEEINLDKNKGWNNPRNTDTLLFIKSKTTIKKRP
ncbi:MAG: hypothetical protein WAM46_10945 [Flavobacterium sp.]